MEVWLRNYCMLITLSWWQRVRIVWNENVECTLFIWEWMSRKKKAVQEPPQYAPATHPLCGRWSASRCRADRNVAVGSHSRYVPTLTIAADWRLKAAVSKATWWSWPLTVVSVSRVTWATSVPILVILGLSVLDLGLMYVTDVSLMPRLLGAEA